MDLKGNTSFYLHEAIMTLHEHSVHLERLFRSSSELLDPSIIDGEMSNNRRRDLFSFGVPFMECPFLIYLFAIRLVKLLMLQENLVTYSGYFVVL